MDRLRNTAMPELIMFERCARWIASSGAMTLAIVHTMGIAEWMAPYADVLAASG